MFIFFTINSFVVCFVLFNSFSISVSAVNRLHVRYCQSRSPEDKPR